MNHLEFTLFGCVGDGFWQANAQKNRLLARRIRQRQRWMRLQGSHRGPPPSEHLFLPRILLPSPAGTPKTQGELQTIHRTIYRLTSFQASRTIRKIMHPLAKRLWSVHVWMTAITTLFASISPGQCVCPDGRRKLFCLGITCGTKGCCCCGACCSGARSDNCSSNSQRTCMEASNQKCCCCCQGASTQDSAATAEHSHVHGKGCRLMLSQSDLVAESGKNIAENDCPAGFLFQDGPSLVLPIALACPLAWSYETYRPPPPPDLIVNLQHFVI